MNTIKQLVAIAGSVLVITGFRDISDVSYIASAAYPVVDTVPKRTDTVPKGNRPDSMSRSDTTVTDTMATTSRYTDLSTGQPVDLYYDPKTRRTYSSMTNEPVDFYVDMSTGDTIYGRGRYVVNNYIVRSADNAYRLDEGKVKIDKNEIKIKDGSKKWKMDKSSMKIKDGNMKGKADSTGAKMKGDDMKRKMDDGRIKTKNE
jgi:hypothetical protein